MKNPVEQIHNLNLNNIFVASHNKDKLLHLQDFTFHEIKPDIEIEVGSVLKQDEKGVFDYHELEESTIYELSENERVVKFLDNIISEECSGKIVYDVAWWAMDFNTFMQAFTKRYFDV